MANSNTYLHCHRARRSAHSSNPSNLITITVNRLHHNGYHYGANNNGANNNKTGGSPLAGRISLCSLNARSLRNKTAAFVDLVCDVKADIFTICESWLTANDSAVLSELSPPGYKTLCHCPRANKTGGGTALLSRDGIEVVKVLSTDKSSFEVSEWLVSTGATRLRVIIVYRPPYSAEHPVSTSIFINEFTDYLESLVMFSEPLIISGDFNIHADMSHSPDTIRFRDLLERHLELKHSGIPGLSIPAFRVEVFRRFGLKYSGVPGLSIPAFRVLVFRRSGFKYSGVPGLSILAFRVLVFRRSRFKYSGVPGFSIPTFRV